MADREAQLRRLAEAARRRSLVVFVGAGASKGAALADGTPMPDWNGLVDPLRTALGLTDKADDALNVAPAYVDAEGRRALMRHVRERLAGVATP